MASFYQAFVSTNTNPDLSALLASLRNLDASAGIQHTLGAPDFIIKKASIWTAAQIATAQNVIDTAPPVTPQRQAQNQIDAWPIAERALVLALIDQLNALRAALPAPLPAITPTQAIAAIRAKAGTL